jgi:hypothetical protein
MSSSYTVGYIIGSLSTESINRTLSKALIRLAPGVPSRTPSRQLTRCCSSPPSTTAESPAA